MKLLVLSVLLCFALSTVAVGQIFEKAEFEISSGDILRYAILKPAKIDSGQKYPLVITLHRVGGRGKENWEGNCAANRVRNSASWLCRFSG